LENFKENKRELDRELERFVTLLNQLLPHYHELLKKKDLTPDELQRLGDIEHYLLGVNAKIIDIKGKLEQDLFGQSLDIYYKLKEDAKKGDVNSKVKLEKMREIFTEALKSGDIMNFN
jgi:hypothetical protein